MPKSSKSLTPAKSPKPYEGFPLTPHPSGRWCKKIRGKLHYFGKLDDPDAALERFNREGPFLKDGRTPPPIDTGDGCTLRLLCNAFLTFKKDMVDSGELSHRSFHDYFRTCEFLIDQFGRDRRVDDLRPDDFEGLRKTLAKTRGPVALKNEVNRCRMVLKYAFDRDLVEKPVRYGRAFDRPSAKTLRKARNEAGRRLFNAEQLRCILDALDGEPVAVKGNEEPVTLTADPALKAMTLLGVNAGFGNTDVAMLPQSALDLEKGWVDFPRPKTGIERHVPLWPETAQALEKAISKRADAKHPADAGLVFLTRTGKRWVRVQIKQGIEEESGEKSDKQTEAVVSLDAISQRFAKLLKLLKINGRRGLGFYTLRHVFETEAGEAKDQVAVDAIMGHVDPSMGGQYRERISDERLRAVTEHVRAWLFGPGGSPVRAQPPLSGTESTLPTGSL